MKEMNIDPFPVLKTQRLLLRQLEANDAAAIFLLRSDERISKYIDRPVQKSIEEAQAFINKIDIGIKSGKSYYWVICLIDNPELIGTICLWNISEDRKKAEIGYELRPAYQGKGIMNEALKKVIEYTKKHTGFEKLEAYTHMDNEKSTRLLKQNNFIQDTGIKDIENPKNIIFTLIF